MKSFMFLIYCHSPLHAGTGQDMGKVDLPIQREKHTNYPCVFASSFKGALRDFCENEVKSNKNCKIDVNEIFGAESASSSVGTAIFTDLKLLFFPVRSSRDTFKWVTTTKVLERFKKDKLISNSLNNGKEIDIEFWKISSKEFSKDDLILEDFILEKEKGNIEKINIPFHQSLDDLNNNNVFNIDENLYNHFVNNSTQIIARNVLNENKISENLWYEEVLPADSILYSFISVLDPGMEQKLNEFKQAISGKVFQIGGNQTIGRGISQLIIYVKESN